MASSRRYDTHAGDRPEEEASKKSRSDRRYRAFLLSGLGRFADVDAEDAPVPITPSSLTQSMASPVACGAAWCEGGGAAGVVGEHVFVPVRGNQDARLQAGAGGERMRVGGWGIAMHLLSQE